MKQLLKVVVSILVPMLAVVVGLRGFSPQPQPQPTGGTIDLSNGPAFCPGFVGDVNALKNAIHLANSTVESDTILLAANCVYTLVAPDNGNNGLPVITNSLTIVGNNASIVRNSGSGFRFFNLEPLTASLTLINLTLQNGSAGAGTGGGAIFAKGSVALVASRLLTNTHTNFGGAVFMGSTNTLVIQGSVFQGNSSSSASGGAVFARQAIIQGATFVNNHAADDGGALDLESGSGTESHITGAQFISNTATNGGALNVLSNSVGITDSNFLSNTATANGGGIQALTSTVRLESTIFPTVTTFQHNRAASGGALLLSGPGALTLEFARFADNSVSGQGGAIALVNGAGPANINDTAFTLNSASAGGALLIGSGSRVNQSGNSTYLSNTAAITSGGAILNYGRYTLSNATFTANEAQTSGGAVENSAGATFRGAPSGSLPADPCEVNPSFLGPLFLFNRVPAGDGGAIHSDGSLSMSRGSLFIGNSGQRGGALFGSDVVLLEAGFQNNNAISGGAVFVSGTLQMTSTFFISNGASMGGGLFVQGAATSRANLYQRNSAAQDGGGAQVSGRLDDTCSRFIGNHAGDDAGGLMGTTGSALVLTATRFISNTAADLGGGARAGGVITSNGVLFKENRARLGGGLFADNESNLFANQFIANLAESGGGLLQNRKDARVVNSLFARNSISATTGTGAAMALNFFAPTGTSIAGRITLLHNTVADIGLNPKPAIVVFSGTVGITDTIVVSHSTGISRTAGSVLCTFALFFANSTNTSGVVCGTEVDGDPRFVNAGADDYHITSTSAAKDNGVNAGVSTDFEGELRPQGGFFDIGFDELPAASDLLVTKEVLTTTVQVGSAFTYTIRVTNTGGSPTAFVVLTDTLSAPVVHAVFTDPSANNACGVFDLSEVRCTLNGFLNVGSVATVRVQVQPNATGVLTNTVTVSSPNAETNPANNTAVVSVTAKAQLFLPLVVR